MTGTLAGRPAGVLNLSDTGCLARSGQLEVVVRDALPPRDPGRGPLGGDHAADGAGHAEAVEVLGGAPDHQAGHRLPDAGRVDVPRPVVDAVPDELDRGGR